MAKGLKLSHLRYRLPDTVITSGSDVDRAVRGIKSFGTAPPKGLGGRVPTKVVAVGEGPAGRARSGAILAFFSDLGH